MLIRDAELDFGGRRGDVRVAEGRVAEIAPRLSRRAGETVVTAGGCALLPSLCDHHLHLKATAAARASVDCADAACPDATALAERLQAADRVLPAGGWLRGNGFHEHVLAGSGAAPDRDWLDRVVPHRPARLQHRSGRMWLLNTAALRAIGVDEDDGDTPLERRGGRFTGRLYDADGWLRARTGARRPDLGDLSRALWALGVTAVTDCSHDNDRDDVAAFGAAQRSGALLQDVLVMGNADLDGAGVPADGDDGPELAIGARKFHLHDAALPDLDELTAAMRAAHAAGRNVAAHCVSRVDLAFALAAWRAAGARPGDRVEHASVAPPEALAEIAALGLTGIALAFVQTAPPPNRWPGADEWSAASIVLLAFAALCATLLRPGRSANHPPAGASPDLVVHASQTGLAEMLAQRTAAAIAGDGDAAPAHALGRLDMASLSGAERAWFVVSTTGEGDAPDPARHFVADAMHHRPDLGHHGQVAADGLDGPLRIGRQFGLQRGELFLAPRHGDHMRAPLRRAQRRGAPDAPAGAGNHPGLAGEIRLDRLKGQPAQPEAGAREGGQETAIEIDQLGEPGEPAHAAAPLASIQQAWKPTGIRCGISARAIGPSETFSGSKM